MAGVFYKKEETAFSFSLYPRVCPIAVYPPILPFRLLQQLIRAVSNHHRVFCHLQHCDIALAVAERQQRAQHSRLVQRLHLGFSPGESPLISIVRWQLHSQHPLARNAQLFCRDLTEHLGAGGNHPDQRSFSLESPDHGAHIFFYPRSIVQRDLPLLTSILQRTRNRYRGSSSQQDRFSQSLQVCWLELHQPARGAGIGFFEFFLLYIVQVIIQNLGVLPSQPQEHILFERLEPFTGTRSIQVRKQQGMVKNGLPKVALQERSIQIKEDIFTLQRLIHKDCWVRNFHPLIAPLVIFLIKVLREMRNTINIGMVAMVAAAIKSCHCPMPSRLLKCPIPSANVRISSVLVTTSGQ